jgi:YbbR domain-containing protein
MGKALMKNLRTLSIALILAVAVWVSAVTASDPDEVKAYPRTITLEVVGLDPALVIAGDLPNQIYATLKAPRSVWDQLISNPGMVNAVVDLSGLGAGDHQIAIQIQVNMSPVRIVTSTPALIAIMLEPLITKTLPVKIALAGEPAVGYAADELSVEPLTVIVSGAESQVNRVEKISAAINISGARDSIETSLELSALDQSGRRVSDVTITPATSQVTLPITQQGGYRDIAVKVVVRGQVADGYRLTNISVFPPVVTVYSTKPELVLNLPGYVETAMLNLSGASDNIETGLELILPEDISVIGDQTVQVTIGVAPIEGSLTINNKSVEIIGLTDGLAAQISPLRVDIILSGPLPLLDRLTSDNVHVIVDLANLGAGTHQITPRVEIYIDQLHVDSINPGTIEVIIIPATPTPTTP